MVGLAQLGNFLNHWCALGQRGFPAQDRADRWKLHIPNFGPAWKTRVLPRWPGKNTKIRHCQRGCFRNSRAGHGNPSLNFEVSAEEHGFSALTRSWPRFVLIRSARTRVGYPCWPSAHPCMKNSPNWANLTVKILPKTTKMKGKGTRTYLEEVVRKMVSVRAGNRSVNFLASPRSSRPKIVKW